MRMRTAAVAWVLAGGVVAGCATGPPVEQLPAASTSSDDGDTTSAEGSVEYEASVEHLDVGRLTAADVGSLPQPAPIVVLDDPVQFFRAQLQACSQYTSLLHRDADSPPRVEEDRFTGAVLVRELDADTALIEDGRGTRLVVRLVVGGWPTTTGRVLAESLRPEDLPEPYRSTCPPEVFIGAVG